MDEMKVVTLKNGSREALPLVKVSLMALKSLMQDSPIAFYELVMICRDRNHEIWGSNITDLLKGKNLLEYNGQPHESIRNIVLSAVTGDSFDMVLENPIVQTAV